MRIGAIFACKVLLEAIFGPVQKWRSRARARGSGSGLGAPARARGSGSGWGWGLGLGLGGLGFHFYILKEISTFSKTSAKFLQNFIKI